MKSGVFKHQYFPEIFYPVLQPVLTQQLQKELEQLQASLRKQVRNVKAVGSWLARYQTQAAADQLLAHQLPQLQHSRPEALSFHLKASPEAFALFTRTLRRISLYLHENARVDYLSQVLQLRLDFKALDAWEYKMSVLLEQLSPEAYLETLLYERQQFRVVERQAS